MKYYSYNLSDNIIFMIGGLFNANANWSHSKRYHRGDYELILCKKGILYLKIANQLFTVKEGEFIIIPPFSTTIGYHPSPSNVEFYWLHFFLPASTSVTNEIPHINSKKIILPQLGRISNLNRYIILIHQLLELDLTDLNNQKIANCFITIILTGLSRDLSLSTQIKNTKAEQVEKMKEWIRTNLYISPTVTMMAEHIGLNPQYFSRLFKKVAGVSPKHYLMNLKLQTAQSLLIRTNLSIKEIANNSYFKNEKLFLRQFRKSIGITPSQYRAQFSKIYHNNQVINPVLPIPEEITKHLTDIPDPGKALD